MSDIDRSIVTLRLFGDDLDPEAVSMLLGARPTQSCRKGDEVGRDRTNGTPRLACTGSWRLSASDRAPEDIEAQVAEILLQLTDDLDVWASLARYEPDLFCGVFMGGSNDMLSLSAAVLRALGERGIALLLDIYDSDDAASARRAGNAESF